MATSLRKLSAREIRARKQKANAARVQKLKVTSGKTKEEIRALNEAEGRTARELADDPSAKEMYENMRKLSTLKGDEREKVLEHLRQVAEENLAPFFEAERQELLTDVKFALETIKQKFGQFDEATQREFDQAIEGLDVDSARELRDTFTAVNQNNLIDSGMMSILAQRIIDDEQFSAKQLKEDLDDDLRFSGERQDLAEREVGIKQDKAERDIRQEQTEAVESQAQQEAGRLELNEILSAISDGVAEIDPATGSFRFSPPEETAPVTAIRTRQTTPAPRDISTFTDRTRRSTQPQRLNLDRTPTEERRTRRVRERLTKQVDDTNDIRSRSAQRGLARLNRR